MAKIILRSLRDQAYHWVYLSAGISMTVSLLLGFVSGMHVGSSALWGGLTWFMPNLWVAYRLFSRVETQTRIFIVTFFIVELLKLVLYGMLFILLYKYLKIAVMPFLIGFMLAQMAFWVSPLLLRVWKR